VNSIVVGRSDATLGRHHRTTPAVRRITIGRAHVPDLLAARHLREVRQRAGLSQTRLAAVTGIAQPIISKYEHGSRWASPAAIRRLLDGIAALKQGNDLDALVDWPPDPKEN
jgi:predicted transcriptional regulator